MIKKIHHKKWNKKLRRIELQMVWNHIDSNAPSIALDLMGKYQRTVSEGW